MIEIRVARDERGIPGEEWDAEGGWVGLSDALAPLPLGERVELIERMGA